MLARDVMTKEVVTVHPNTPVPEIARLLLARRISAVPVVDDGDAPIGMVSEGDLIGRAAPDPAPRGDWWLALLAEAVEAPPPEVGGLVAQQVMSSPVVTVTEDTDLAEIARLIARFRIKRVPVVRQDRLVGIVSRADLLRGFATAAPAPTRQAQTGLIGQVFAELDRGLHHAHPPAPPASDRPTASEATAARFEAMAKAFKTERLKAEEARLEAEAERRRERAAALGGQHLLDEAWQGLLERAAEAARRGETEFLMLRFPSQLCSDGGRAVNVPEPTWPATLRGEPAELYLRWEREMKPHGFALTARVLDYPGGMPGDIGLFLTWAEADA